MRDYEVKRKSRKLLEGEGLKNIMAKYFQDVSEEGDAIAGSYGAMKKIKAKYDGKKLWVETETDPSASDEVALDTVRTYNRFLEEATGYTAKERKKLANKMAKEGA